MPDIRQDPACTTPNLEELSVEELRELAEQLMERTQKLLGFLGQVDQLCVFWQSCVAVLVHKFGQNHELTITPEDSASFLQTKRTYVWYQEKPDELTGGPSSFHFNILTHEENQKRLAECEEGSCILSSEPYDLGQIILPTGPTVN